jgi:hypothetical protein
MAFKKTAPAEAVPTSPEALFLQLPRRKIPGVLLHQGQIMQRYAALPEGEPDVALQLPTGSGKTLVGLLIGEWRRRKYKERVVYLCPTRQLVNQVVEQAEEKYGLSVNGFTGQKKDYAPAARAEYQSASRIAITTYNSLFNTNPFFQSADVIIVDDAHASENYISSMWSLSIERRNAKHAALHSALSDILLKPLLEPIDHARLTGQIAHGLADISWVEKVPTPTFAKIREEFSSVVDQHAASDDSLKFTWQLLRDHVEACHLYLSSNEILLRPLIPPTWTHKPFHGARQRIYMSATLGAGGDLERLTGRRKITRLPVPDGWDKQGIGRRFFIFPEMSLSEQEATNLRHGLLKIAPRSVMLVPSDRIQKERALDAAKLGLQVFGAEAIEDSKKTFVNTNEAIAVIANRYDGIDFPGDECRLLFLDGFPRTTNAQERFLVSRMGAGSLLRERIQTRVVQAVGRCTRSLQDYSAVVVTGEEMTDYLNNQNRRRFFHPELQAELEFGANQSTGVSQADLLENFKIFLENGPTWEEVNAEILAKRDAAIQSRQPDIDKLDEAVPHEIAYQQRLWSGQYEQAVESAGAVLGYLGGEELRGYRALWSYLAGSAAWLGEKRGIPTLAHRARSYFADARDNAAGIRWLARLARHEIVAAAIDQDQQARERQVEQLESQLRKLGIKNERKYASYEKAISDGLANSEWEAFELAHRDLGILLGFQAGRHDSNASPDTWWADESFCLVFEDHSEALLTSPLGAAKARQVSGHPNWIRANADKAPLSPTAKVLPVLITPVLTAEDGAVPHLNNFVLWPLSEFRSWSVNALAVVRDLRRTLGEEGDLVWRALAQAKLQEHRLDGPGLYHWLSTKHPVGILRKNLGAPALAPKSIFPGD